MERKFPRAKKIVVNDISKQFSNAFALGLTKYIETTIMHQTCLTCDNFNEDKETCSAFENQRPPARVIAFGCDMYDSFDDDIPF